MAEEGAIIRIENNTQNIQNIQERTDEDRQMETIEREEEEERRRRRRERRRRRRRRRREQDQNEENNNNNDNNNDNNNNNNNNNNTRGGEGNEERREQERMRIGVGNTIILNKISAIMAKIQYPLFKIAYVKKQIRTDQKTIKKATQIIQFWTQNIEVIGLAIMMLQYISLVITPELPWSEEFKQKIAQFSIVRTLALEQIITQTIYGTIDNKTGEILNFIIPGIIAITYTIIFIILITMYIASLAMHEKINKIMGMAIHGMVLALYPLYIPIITIYSRSIFCNPWNTIAYETYPIGTCYTGGSLVIPILSFILLIPFWIIAMYFFATHYDWRPNSKNYGARPHSRYIIIFTSQVGLLIILHALGVHFLNLQNNSFLQIGLSFCHLVAIVQFIGFHIFFLQWYKSVTNYIVASSLMVALLAALLSILVSGFYLLFPQFEKSFTSFPSIALLAAIVLCGIVGTGIVELRLYALFLTLNPLSSPRILQARYQLQEDDLFIPRGDFEVEINTRYLPNICGTGYENDGDGRPEDHDASMTQEVAEEATQRIHIRQGRITPTQLPDNLDDMVPSDETVKRKAMESRILDFYNSAISLHPKSSYIYLNYATYQVHIMNQLLKGINLLYIGTQYISPLSIDFRISYLIRLTYWEELLNTIYTSIRKTHPNVNNRTLLNAFQVQHGLTDDQDTQTEQAEQAEQDDQDEQDETQVVVTEVESEGNTSPTIPRRHDSII